MTNRNLEIIEVSAGVICRHGLFLATQRPDGKPYAGYWELPGGKREANETPDETLYRELAEELGIKILSFQLLKNIRYQYPERNFEAYLHFYHVGKFEGEPCPGENQNMRWISWSEIRDMDFLPADMELLNSMCPVDFPKA